VFTASANLTYLNRSAAEQDRGHKQLIPYVLILCNGKILRYQRGKGGGETRLHGLYSVGVGGHISEEDNGLFSTGIGYHEAMWRELMEEVAIEQTREATVGLINDDSTDVGFVHLGVVHVVHVDDERVASGRDGMVGAKFVPIAEAVKDLGAYESWSRFCLEQLDVLLARAGAEVRSST
jgi:predicted NUDIX family phosphoesterase